MNDVDNSHSIEFSNYLISSGDLKNDDFTIEKKTDNISRSNNLGGNKQVPLDIFKYVILVHNNLKLYKRNVLKLINLTVVQTFQIKVFCFICHDKNFITNPPDKN